MDATSQGYSEDEVLNFLSNAYPHLKKNINKALAVGHNVNQIVSFLSNLMNSQTPQKTNQPRSQQAVHAVKRQQDLDREKQLLKTGLSVAGGALAFRGAMQAAPRVAGAVKGALQAEKPVEAVAGQVGQALGKEVAESLPASRLKDLKADLFNFRLGPKIEKLAANSPVDAIPGMLQKQVTEEQKSYLLQKFGKSFEDLVKDYANSYLQKGEAAPLSREGVSQQFESALPQEEMETPKSRTVMTPDGKVGQITDERQGIGTVEFPNGTKSRKKISDFDIQSPEAEEFLTALRDTIPEEERSSVIGFASYNAPSKMMAVQFPTGDFYVYPEVNSDEFQKIISNATLAKTSGDTWRGVWTKGKESRGAGLYQVLKELEKREGKNFIKFAVKDGYEYPLTTIIREIEKRIERKRKNKAF